jgi:hypothetical protein
LSIKNNLFIWLSGADPQALESSSEGEQRKFLKLGITLMIPMLMGWLGMWFASPYIGLNGTARIAITIMWGLVILTIDTYLISSLISNASEKRRSVWLAITRIFLAVFIGIVISHPLVLKILEKNIDEEVTKMKKEKIMQIVSENRDSAKIWSLHLLHERLQVDSSINCLEILIKAEANGINVNSQCGTTSGDKNRGFRYKQILQEITEKKKERDSLTNAITQYKIEFNNLIQADTNHLNKIFSQDYLTRMEALERLKKNKSTSSSTTLLTIFLTVFFVLLDSIAIISKLISKPGEHEFNYSKQTEFRQAEHLEKLKLTTEFVNNIHKNEKEYGEALVNAVYDTSIDVSVSEKQGIVREFANGFRSFHITGSNSKGANLSRFKPFRLIVFLSVSLIFGLLLWHFLKIAGMANDEIAIAITFYTTITSIISTVLIK